MTNKGRLAVCRERVPSDAGALTVVSDLSLKGKTIG